MNNLWADMMMKIYMVPAGQERREALGAGQAAVAPGKAVLHGAEAPHRGVGRPPGVIHRGAGDLPEALRRAAGHLPEQGHLPQGILPVMRGAITAVTAPGEAA